jgi:hypothetical protein
MRPHPARRAVVPLLPLLSLVVGLLAFPGSSPAHAGSATTGDRTATTQAAAALTVHGLDDVRGNLTLPAAGAHGTSVTWKSDKPSVIDATDIVHRPKRGAGAKSVELTAVVTRGEDAARRTFSAFVPELPKKQKYTGYAMSYFTGEGTADGEQIRMSLSRGNDALHWRELNGGRPVLTSELGTKGLRDPFIIRSPEGDKFHL